MSLLSELKRRNVIRMAVLYTVAAWLVMQVAEVLIGLGILPESSGLWVMIVLAIGFPIALLSSWFYEITPEGLALEKDVPEGQSIAPSTGRRTDFVIIAVLCAGLIVFAWDKWWPNEPAELSIAVLPFENMSSDPEQEYFSDGISEEILNLLAQIHPLKVIARTSSFSFKGKNVDVASIAEQLGVRHVLEGSVRRDADRVRITAQLIDARDSSHLWSEVYERDLSAASLFHVQSEVARAITSRLKIALTEPEEQRLAVVPTENTEAYEAYLLGRQRLRDRKVATLEDAVEQFARAIDLDANFGGAYAGLVDACFLYGRYSGGQRHAHCPTDVERHLQLARKAVELAPDRGDAWTSLGMAIDVYRAEFEGLETGGLGAERDAALKAEARAAFEAGIELNPSNWQGYHWYAQHLNSSDEYATTEEWWAAWRAGVSAKVIDRGLVVDPLATELHYIAAWYPWFARSREKSLWHARRIVEIAPDSPRGYERLGEVLWSEFGRADEMVRMASKAAALDPQHAWYPAHLGFAYRALGDFDMALAYFKRARGLSKDSPRMSEAMQYSQGLTLLDAGRQDEAIAIFESLRVSPSPVLGPGDVLCVLAGFDLAAGKPEQALARYRKDEPDCFETQQIGQEDWNCDDPLGVARVLQELREHELAAKLIDLVVTAMKPREENFSTLEYRIDADYRIRILALAGRRDEALAMLEKQVHLGWRGFEFYEWRYFAYRDMELDSIRDDPRFRAAVAVIEADMAQQLENVREMERKGEIPTLEEVRAELESAEK